jgi:hypothetical protein
VLTTHPGAVVVTVATEVVVKTEVMVVVPMVAAANGASVATTPID